MILPDQTEEKAAKLKKYLAKVATLEEDEAFLKKISTKDPDSKESESSGSEESKEGQESDWLLTVGQNSNRNKISEIDVNNYIQTSSCFATTAELLRPKKKAKTQDLSMVTLGYI